MGRYFSIAQISTNAGTRRGAQQAGCPEFFHLLVPARVMCDMPVSRHVHGPVVPTISGVLAVGHRSPVLITLVCAILQAQSTTASSADRDRSSRSGRRFARPATVADG